MRGITLIWALALFIAGCAGYSSTGGPGSNIAPNLHSKVQSDAALLRVNSLLVLPVQVEPSARESNLEATSLYDNVSRAFLEESNLELVGDRKEILASRGSRPISSKQAAELARSHGADAVLVTRLHDFVERSGSKVGVTQPARVSFSMEMLSAATGLPLWEASYHFKDQALSDNLFRIEDRLQKGEAPHWRAAADLLSDGLRLASRDFSRRRSAQFHSSQL